MKLTSVTRCTLALVEAIHIARQSANKNLRNFRKEFCRKSACPRWAALFFKQYLAAKNMATSQGEVLRDHLARLVRTITLKPRIQHLQEVAA